MSITSEFWLSVYPAKSGQWSGQVFEGDQVVCGIAGCSSPEEVEERAYEDFPDLEEVKVRTWP